MTQKMSLAAVLGIEPKSLLQPHLLKDWAQRLPLANPVDTATRLGKVLAYLNQQQVDPVQRFQLQELLRPLCARVYSLIKSQQLRLAQPLAEKAMGMNQITRAMNQELGRGYQHVVNELATLTLKSRDYDRVMPAAIMQGIVAYTDQVIDSYLVYEQVPKGLWGDIHELYSFADVEGFEEVEMRTHSGKDELRLSLRHAYMRLALLTIANPYHLLRGEALVLYRKLNRWAKQARFIRAEQVQAEGFYYVDLFADQPPQFVSADQAPPRGELRVLDVQPAMTQLVAELKGLLERYRPKQVHESMPLNLRGERDFMVRIRHAWSGRASRRFERSLEPLRVVVAPGLRSAHYHVSDGRDFTPESDEQRLQVSTALAPQGLDLSPTHMQPWWTEEETAAASGADRSSVFGDQERETALGPAGGVSNITLASGEFDVSLWQQRDRSATGLSLFSADSQVGALQVGEAVAFIHEQGGTAHWSVGVVRWLQRGKRGAEIGIKAMARSALPVATRAVSGAGTGSEYFRALLVPRVDPKTKPASLIAPAAIYDVGTVLLMNLGEDLFYVRLTSLMDATKSFSHFVYELIDAPHAQRLRQQQRHGDYRRDVP